MQSHERLRELRESRGLSREDLAKCLNLSYSAVAKYESGDRVPPQDVLIRLAEVLGVSADYLLARSDDPRGSDVPEAVLREILAKSFPPGMIPVGRTVKVPIVGAIRAGVPILAQQNIEGWEDVSEERVRDGQFFFLRVKGDSMEPTIHDGYLVLVREQAEVEDGRIAVVMVDAEQAAVKRVYRQNGEIILKSDNPKYRPIIVRDADARIIGRIVEARFEVK